MAVILAPFSVERMERAVTKVHERLIRSTAALERAGAPYAVIGGNAVAAWVSRINETAVRNTRDADILLRRSDLDAARVALEAIGFTYRHVHGVHMFLDGPDFGLIGQSWAGRFSPELGARLQHLIDTPEG